MSVIGSPLAGSGITVSTGFAAFFFLPASAGSDTPTATASAAMPARVKKAEETRSAEEAALLLKNPVRKTQAPRKMAA